MKALRSTIAFAVLSALAFGLPSAYAGSVLPLPGVNGPFLGDPVTNLFTIEQSLQNNTFSNFSSFTTLSIAAGNTTSTVLNTGFNFLTANVTVTGTMLLPTAKPAADVVVANNTGVVVVLYGNGNSPFTPGGTDFVNNVATTGAAAVAGSGSGGFVLTNGYTVTCIVPQGGNWWCR